MGRPAASRSAAKKGRRKRPGGRWRNLPVKRILVSLILISMLLFSLGALGYMVFFRTAVAAIDQSTKSVWSDRLG